MRTLDTTMLERLVEASSPHAIKAYERKIGSLEKEKLLVSEKLENFARPKPKAEDMLELTICFLASPYSI